MYVYDLHSSESSVIRIVNQAVDFYIATKNEGTEEAPDYFQDKLMVLSPCTMDLDRGEKFDIICSRLAESNCCSNIRYDGYEWYPYVLPRFLGTTAVA